MFTMKGTWEKEHAQIRKTVRKQLTVLIQVGLSLEAQTPQHNTTNLLHTKEPNSRMHLELYILKLKQIQYTHEWI